MRTTEGTVVGTHTGIAHYTVGQRAGIGGADSARYVTHVDATTNTIVIGREDELFASGLIADEVNLIRPGHFAKAASVLAMIRYRAIPVAAHAEIQPDGALRLSFAEPQRAVTPGQLVALLAQDGEEVLGAATIREAL